MNDYLSADLNDYRQLRIEFKVDSNEEPRVNIREWVKYPSMTQWRPTIKGVFLLVSDFHEKIMPLLIQADKSIS